MYGAAHIDHRVSDAGHEQCSVWALSFQHHYCGFDALTAIRVLVACTLISWLPLVCIAGAVIAQHVGPKISAALLRRWCFSCTTNEWCLHLVALCKHSKWLTTGFLCSICMYVCSFYVVGFGIVFHILPTLCHPPGTVLFLAEIRDVRNEKTSGGQGHALTTTIETSKASPLSSSLLVF